MTEQPSGAVGLRKDVEDLAKRVAALDGQGGGALPDFSTLEARLAKLEDAIAGQASLAEGFKALEGVVGEVRLLGERLAAIEEAATKPAPQPDADKT